MTTLSARAKATSDVADEYAHVAFHRLAQGAPLRAELGGLFIAGFDVGAQIALVEPDLARHLVDELADHNPAVLVALADRLERIRSAR